MRRVLGIAMIASLAMPGISVAKDKPPISLPKTSKWEINYDEDSCHLLAKFGEDKQAVIIRMTRYQPSDVFDLTLYGEPLKSFGPTVPVRIGYGINAPVKREAISGTGGDKQPLLILNGERIDGLGYTANTTPPAIDAGLEQRANKIDITITGGKRFSLESGSLGAPMAAMRTCISNLVRKWGYDPQQQAGLSALAKPLKSPGSWLGSDDYPKGPLANGHNGLVQFRLDLDETGKVTGCFILHRTQPDDFADLTCKLIAKRARFSPALDKDGKPSKSYFISKVRFVIPA